MSVFDEIVSKEILWRLFLGYIRKQRWRAQREKIFKVSNISHYFFNDTKEYRKQRWRAQRGKFFQMSLFS